jgi:hypothetical protein
MEAEDFDSIPFSRKFTPAETDAALAKFQADKEETKRILAELGDKARETLKQYKIFKNIIGSNVSQMCVTNIKKSESIGDYRNRTFDKILKDKSIDVLNDAYKSLFGEPRDIPPTPQGKKEAIKKFFLESGFITTFCQFSNAEATVEQADKLNKICLKEGLDTKDEEGKKGIADPDSNPSLWNKIIKKEKLSNPKARELLTYLEGPNVLSTYQKAADQSVGSKMMKRFRFNEGPIGPNPPTTIFNKSKFLANFLSVYKLSGYPIQIAIDFNAEDISDDFVIEEIVPAAVPAAAPAEEKESIKKFVKSMVTNMS